MAQNEFDQASRYTAKLDPQAFFAWATWLTADQFAFDEWLDTRNIPFPGDADHTNDTIARVTNPTVVEAPWAVAVEFQSEPDPLMFGRLMVYLGYLWQSLKPDEERGSRFNVAAVVVNLTGNGEASRDMRWPDARLTTQLQVIERNLAHENADELMTGIEVGKWSRALLPWLPLMTGGDKEDIIERWKKVAEAEPSFHRKVEYAGLACVFASACSRETIWKKALEGWNVRQSSVVQEWKAEARAEGRLEGRLEEAIALLIAALEAKFGKIAEDVETKIRGTSDLTKLHEWVMAAVKAATLDEFRAAAGLS